MVITADHRLRSGRLGFAIWNVFIRQGRTGQTIGKQALSLKLIRDVTARCSDRGSRFVRYLAHILDTLSCGLGYLWPLWDAKRQTFADKVCSTIVIKV